MQVYLREAASIARGTLALPLGDIQMAPVDVQDVARIAAKIALASDVDSMSFPITGPEALTMNEIAAILTETIGRVVSYLPLSVEERSHHLLTLGMPPVFVAALEEQAIERLRHPKAAVAIASHERFNVKPTTFREFASRYVSLLSGRG
jgi:uncharacterized protein YbjT (DUF2867 family)